MNPAGGNSGGVLRADEKPEQGNDTQRFCVTADEFASRSVASYRNHSSSAARKAITAPMLTPKCIARVWAKPRSQGETTSQRPSARLTHSSHMAKAIMAASERMMIAA